VLIVTVANTTPASRIVEDVRAERLDAMILGVDADFEAGRCPPL